MKPFLFRFLLTALALVTCAMAQAQSLRPSNRLLQGPSQRIAPTGPQQADFIIAVVNSEPITNNELRARVLRTEQQLSQQGTTPPPRNALAQRMLEQLILERAQLQLARETGVKVDEVAIDQAVQSIAQQNQITVEALRRRLITDGLDWQQFRNDLRDQLLLTKLREREMEPRIRMNDLEVDQFIREQQGNNDPSAIEANLAQILISVPEGATPAQIEALRVRAQQALERAQKGEDFGALVTELSTAPDKSSGGQFGLRPLDRYPVLFIEAVRSLPAGSVTGPLRSGAGFHILKVVEKIQSGLIPNTVRQTRARHILLRPSAQLSEAAAATRLLQLRQQVNERKADFAALAREFSQDGSAANGGDLGWANPGQFVPEFEEAMNKLAPGQIADPLTSRFGVHLIQVMERRDAQLSQREQRDIARAALRNKKLEEAYVLWAQEVRGRAYVELREPPQ